LRSADSMLEGRSSSNTVAAGQYQIYMPWLLTGNGWP
jgi:hypothetical protein